MFENPNFANNANNMIIHIEIILYRRCGTRLSKIDVMENKLAISVVNIAPHRINVYNQPNIGLITLEISSKGISLTEI